MRSLRYRLPPLNSLVAFEASARLLSFTRAGQELLVTREAISRQVRALEDYLGLRLFNRLYRALELTADGKSFQSAVQRSLAALAESTETLQRGTSEARIVIGATIALSSYWLTPRLPRFRAKYPDAEIRLTASDDPADLAEQGIDACLRYGDGNWPGHLATHLFDIESFPVCAPGYLAKGPPIAEPKDLLAHTLLNLDGPSHAREDWTWWFAAAGAPMTPRPRFLGFDNYTNVVQAAVNAQGIALGFSGILDAVLANGSLVRPFPLAHETGHAVYLTVPKRATMSPVTRAFVDWVIAEAGGEAAG